MHRLSRKMGVMKDVNKSASKQRRSMRREDVKFVIIEDTREQQPLSFRRETIRTCLKVGDYSVQGYEQKVCAERKSIADLCGTCDHKNRDRFKRELTKMQKDYQFYAIVIAGYKEDVLAHCQRLYKMQCADYQYKLSVNPKARQPMKPEVRAKGVLGSIRSWRATFNAHFYFLGSEQGVAEWVETQFEYYVNANGGK